MEGDGHGLKRAVTETDWRRGPDEAPVTLLEYLDFQCPCCQGSHQAIEALLADLGDRVRYVVREFPVGSIHRNAEQAARAAEAAGRQGRFWGMYRLLLQSKGRLSSVDLESYARELGLDLTRFQEDMESEAVAGRIKQDKWGGLRSGVNGTPTLFVNGIRYESAVCPVQEEELREAVEQALAAHA